MSLFTVDHYADVELALHHLEEFKRSKGSPADLSQTLERVREAVTPIDINHEEFIMYIEQLLQAANTDRAIRLVSALHGNHFKPWVATSISILIGVWATLKVLAVLVVVGAAAVYFFSTIGSCR